MSTLLARTTVPHAITPLPDDPDFDVCIAARQAMTQPCMHIQRAFCSETSLAIACWAGHILRTINPNLLAKVSPGKPAYVDDQDNYQRFHIIVNKLGFLQCSALYTYNDTHSHAEILAEFDRRLQLWNF